MLNVLYWVVLMLYTCFLHYKYAYLLGTFNSFCSKVYMVFFLFLFGFQLESLWEYLFHMEPCYFTFREVQRPVSIYEVAK